MLKRAVTPAYTHPSRRCGNRLIKPPMNVSSNEMVQTRFESLQTKIGQQACTRACVRYVDVHVGACVCVNVCVLCVCRCVVQRTCVHVDGV